MSSSHLPTWLSTVFARFAAWLDRRSAVHVPLLLPGILLATDRRRTATSWFRAAGITIEFRSAYNAIGAVGREARHLALSAYQTIRTCLAGSRRLRVAIDDSPTARYGPHVEGAGRHHNPTPGPAGEKYLYGHVWVSLAWLGQHALFGVLALPLQALLYVRQQDVPALNQEYPWTFKTKLQLAVELVLRRA